MSTSDHIKPLNSSVVGFLQGTALIETILTLAVASIGAQNGWLYTFDETGDEIVCRVGVGKFKNFIGQRRKMGEGLSGSVVERNATLVIDDYDTWTGITTRFPSNILGAAIGVPLRVLGKVVGMIGVGTEPGGKPFASESAIALEHFATMASVALENAQLGTQMSLSERRYRSLIDSVDCVLWESNSDGTNISFISQSVERLLGYPTSDWYNNPNFWRDRLHKDDVARVLAESEAAIINKENYVSEYRMITKNGKEIWIRDVVTQIYDTDQPHQQRGVMFEITQTKLHDERRLLESAMENAHDAIIISEVQDTISDRLFSSKIVYVNEAFIQLSGYQASEIIGQEPSFLNGKDTNPIQLEKLHEAVRQNQPIALELLEYYKGDKPTWVEISVAPVKDEFGRVRHRISTRRDITTRKRAEQLEVARNNTLELLARGKPLDLVLNAATEIVQTPFPNLRCAVVFWHKNAWHMTAPNLGASFQKTFLERVGTSAAARFESQFREGRASWFTNLDDNLTNEDKHLMESNGIQAALGYPILTSTGVLMGAILAFRDTPGEPLHSEIESLEVVSRLTSISVEQNELNEQLSYQANHDALTQLPNRSHFESELEKRLTVLEAQGKQVGLILLDLDGFKQINDTLGHAAGDDLLRQVASRLSKGFASLGMVGRMSGDEFMLRIDHFADSGDLETIAESMLETIRKPFPIQNTEVFITASVGLSLFPNDATARESLIRNADTAMYQVKRFGRNAIQRFTDSLNTQYTERHDLELKLRGALERQEFEVYYQPQFDLTNSMVACEALLRWKSGTEMIAPNTFIPIAVDMGLITAIDSWVLKQVCVQAMKWQHAGYEPIQFSVNVTALQFLRPDFVKSVKTALESTGLDAKYLDLELTEGVFMTDFDVTINRMNELRALGISLSIDDFGTGYSSLSYLQHLPINTLKIDRSFVQALDSKKANPTLVQVIVTMARQLGLNVVAEGVETLEQVRSLSLLSCDRLQGFYFAHPVPALQLEEKLTRTDLQ
jgi:diguanylate cyclase (GGDEF)-like protein/PAS domain S-box-containing protein